MAQGLPLFTVHGAHDDRRPGDSQAPVSPAARARPPVRERVAQAFTQVEDVLYVGIGVVLAVAALGLLINAAVMFARSIGAGAIGGSVVEVLDQLLLILMMIEILYTVQVSFREHALLPEPFLIVGLIAATRRILVVTAEFSVADKTGADGERFRQGMLEIALLTLMTVALVASILMLRRVRDPAKVAAPRS